MCGACVAHARPATPRPRASSAELVGAGDRISSARELDGSREERILRRAGGVVWRAVPWVAVAPPARANAFGRYTRGPNSMSTGVGVRTSAVWLSCPFDLIWNTAIVSVFWLPTYRNIPGGSMFIPRG